MADVDVCLSSHLKEELAWAADKQFLVICYLKTVKVLRRKNKAVLNLKQYCVHCYVALSIVF